MPGGKFWWLGGYPLGPAGLIGERNENKYRNKGEKKIK